MKELTEQREISVVIPVYGCESCLQALHHQLSETLRSVTADYEIIFVDDCSVDGSWDAVREIASQDPAVRAFRLSRNFGQQAAIAAGLANSYGRWTAVIDCDLQDPPRVITQLYAKAREGYDVVYGVRQRTGTPLHRRLAPIVQQAARSESLRPL